MSEIVNPNLPVSPIIAPANPNVEGAASGMNAGTNAPGVGVNVGDYDPKESDWPRNELANVQTQAIGMSPADLNVVEYGANSFNDKVAFVAADGATAPGDVLDVATGAVNRTGKTVPSGSWAFGVIPVA